MAASFEAFRAVVSRIEETSWCTGILPLNASNSTLFYKCNEENSRHIEFNKPVRQDQLEDLAGICECATFGLDQKDVLDETYRKAGKLDAEKFSTQLVPSVEAVILKKVQGLLLHTNRINKNIKLELYKLNVYGPGAFFKAHVDTPRSDSMFGSLVVILPTVHEGGSLVFRHGDQEYTFESANAVSVSLNSACAEAAFVAFFSDVQHEVLPVTLGYRVTLTYNMYFEEDHDTDDSTVSSSNPNSEVVKDLHSSLLAVLEDPEFLPQGGMIGFGLSHRYPFETDASKVNLTDALKHLKGTDAIFRLVCQMSGIDVKVKAYVQEKYRADRRSRYACITDKFPSFKEHDMVEVGLLGYLTDPPSKYYATFDGEGILVKGVIPGENEEDYVRRDWPDHNWKKSPVEIVWLRSLPEESKLKSSFIAYGNDASLSHAYGNVCLAGSISSYEERKASQSSAH